jgi:hypothetical protein
MQSQSGILKTDFYLSVRNDIDVGATIFERRELHIFSLSCLPFTFFRSIFFLFLS